MPAPFGLVYFTCCDWSSPFVLVFFSDTCPASFLLGRSPPMYAQTKAEVAAAAKAKQPLSHAQRSLAKVNKTGMKSIASFFRK